MKVKNRSDEEILRECQAVINVTAQSEQLKFVHNSLGRAIRQSFPFGPGASEREKEIWRECVDNALDSLKRVATTAVIVICIFMLAAPVALADDNSQVPVTIVDKRGQPFAEVAPSTAAPVAVPETKKKKEIFAVRHPRLHKAKRAIKKVCIAAKPVVELGGSCAQIIMMLTGR